MLNLPEVESQVLARWDAEHTFERSVENRKDGTPFVIYEGPPTANGRPGLHHVLTRTFKDMIARFQTMAGRYVERKAGWDEHGLPVEIEIQKELGLHTKAKVEEYGVKRFNEACAASTQKYITEWETLTRRMGYWLDFKNAYRTSDPAYIAKVWKVLRQMHEDGLIYKAAKVVPWACDSGTVVSNAEVAQGYKTVKHTAATVLFQGVDGVHYAAWTTTPWTLPGNMALAVNPDITYKLCRFKDMTVVSLSEIGEFVEIKGRDLVGREYYQPFTDKKCRVLAANFVKAERTGVVHIAPAFGADDHKLWQEQGDGPVVCHVDPDGTFNAPDFLKGKNVIADNFRPANADVLVFLKFNDLLHSVEEYEHEYPHNWRTGKPLIYYVRPSWYVNVNKFRQKMIAANESVHWYPAHVKEGRFGEWLKGDVDWSISRERFWGTPLPFYGDKVVYPDHPHKPEADEPFGPLVRTPEVLDCWFDSGAMPFAAFEQYQRADVVCEAIDQTRGWFYTLLAIGTALKGEAPYKRVVCLGHVLDKDGNKMAKTKGNAVDPLAVFDKYGADVVRWYMASNPVGNSLLFKEEALKAVQMLFNRLWNCHTFLKMYAPNPTERTFSPLLDCWIETRLQMVVNCTGIFYGQTYEFSTVVEEVEKFIDELSNVWLRTNRHRFQGELDASAAWMLRNVLGTLCKVMAPITPFLAEHLWQDLGGEGSVHLQDYPKAKNLSFEDSEMVDNMAKAMQVVSAGHRCRDEAKIRVRQPLASVTVPVVNPLGVFEDYVKDELNVKQIKYASGPVSLDTTLTDALRGEGFVRDFVRAVQDMRKKAGLNVADKIFLTVATASQDVSNWLMGHHAEIVGKLQAAGGFMIDGPTEVKDGQKVGDHMLRINIEKRMP